MTLETVGFSLDKVSHTVFHLVEGRSQNKVLELVLNADHVPDCIAGDLTQLSQILINLLSWHAGSAARRLSPTEIH